MNENRTPTHSDIYLMLGRVEGKIDGFLAQSARQEKQIEDLEDRTDRLERSQTWVVGAAAGIGFVSSILTFLFTGGFIVF
ncbi:hypothetical protein GTQ45_02025 [Pyruvatibacter mobilis]|uniref:Uncharacterized protein n=1 Tax=Pyruvatibacter mobilis TaxID=1712261 RepID=A0A845Q7Z5_9HYPH|nr:hypothetical protein [Pyruvatibacter mobilis]NBG94509.1 hypothetical protein [Pyruvatibacter mobilis]QJD74029.1 hypothetical protein HG718_00575 [Pyruvatibacter mobilis]GGD03519.1 hypothetical protein GCM10011587_04050 [Pyruvatibacter mobilis]